MTFGEFTFFSHLLMDPDLLPALSYSKDQQAAADSDAFLFSWQQVSYQNLYTNQSPPKVLNSYIDYNAIISKSKQNRL